MRLKAAFKTVLEDPRRFLFLAGVAGTVFVADQITKSVIQRTMRLHESIPIVDRLFSLTYIRNPGAAFGLFAEHGNGLRMVFFATISVVAIFFLWTLFVNTPKEAFLGRLSIALVMGGALGNLVDRVRFGEVVDFLDFYIGAYHWPAFNVADSCISVGVALMLWYFIRTPSLHA
ncbi:MAG TPA: signal peptidase II [Nitrospiria bacterium]|jgi:signal peptidase II|nr:signal peptidase II [Nitrospiria bacterium]